MSTLNCLKLSRLHWTLMRNDTRKLVAQEISRRGVAYGRTPVNPRDDQMDSEYIKTASMGTTSACYELIDENIFDKVIGGVKFKDIPVVHIICTRNNTKIDLTHGNGSPLMYKTAGIEGYLKCRKGTTVAAQATAKRVVEHCRDINVNQIRLVFNGLGSGRDASFKVFETSGINIVSLSDRTPAIEPWIQRPRKARRV